MRRRLSARQLCAFCMLSGSAPALTRLCGIGWYAVLAGASFCALLLFGLLLLRRRCGAAGLAGLTLRAWGKRAGSVLLALQLGLAVLLLNGAVSGVAEAFPDVRTQPFTPLVLLCVCAWACGQGKDAVVRACGVLFLFLSALIACVFFFALPDVKPARLLLPGRESLSPALALLLLPVFGLYLAEGQTKRRIPGGWLCLLALFPTLAAAFCAAVPGSRGSFYQMAKSVELLSVAQRIEPLVSVTLVIGFFGTICLLGLSAGEMAAALGGNAKRCASAACLAAIPGALAPLPVPSGVYFAALAATVPLAAATFFRCGEMSIDGKTVLR